MTHALQTLLESIVSANGEMRYDAFAAAMRSFNLPEAAKDDDYTVVEADRGSLVVLDKATAITLSLPAVATAGAGFQFFAANINTGGGTVDPDGAETINGASTLAIPEGAFARIWVNAAGDGWRAAISFDPAKVVFTGGTMDGVAIGGTTPAAGAFTTLKSSDAVVAASSFPNLLTNSGRAGTPNTARVLSALGVPAYLSGFNSATVTVPNKFINDNSTYGGAGAALDSIVEEFLLKYATSATAKKLGTEWGVINVVNGAGTAGSIVVGSDTHYLSAFFDARPYPLKYKFGCYLRCSTGSVVLRHTSDSPGSLDAMRRDGVEVTPSGDNCRVVPADGVVYLEHRRTSTDRGYDNQPYFYSTLGSEYQIAMPHFTFGHCWHPVSTGVLPNAGVFG